MFYRYSLGQLEKIAVSSQTMMHSVLSIPVFLLGLVVAMNLAQAADYHLGVGDVVKIVVYDNEDLTTEDRITGSGTISLPLLGEITIGGFTKSEVEKQIADLLSSGKFIKKPQVNVRILQYREPKVSVLGQVNQPGRYPVEPFKTVLDILAEAGGLNPQAKDQIIVLRREGEKIIKFVLDLRTTINDGNLGDALTIQSGDIISVPKADQFYVYGAVQQPGVFRLERNMTALQALAVAGGLSMRGTDNGLVVRRFDTASNAVIKLPISTMDTLQANDVLVVKESLF